MTYKISGCDNMYLSFRKADTKGYIIVISDKKVYMCT